MLLPLKVVAVDLPIRNDGGSISYATEGLLRRRGELVPPPDLFNLDELNRVLFSDMKNQNDSLKKIKYYLLNGDIRLAKLHLGKLAYTKTKLKPVIHRYLAILTFIEGDFEKTYNYLTLPALQNIPHFGKICVLKVLSQIVLTKLNQMEENWEKCKLENPNNFRERNLIWMDTLVQLKLYPQRGMTKVPFQRIRIASFTADEAKILIKLALYLNQENLIIDQLANLTPDQLQDPEIRELAGQVFFRTGALAKSYRFVEDLKSPNAENIKGNLYVLRDKYELAYAQFKLALEQKKNSQNAMERLLPLAWLLGDWEGGSKYSQQVLTSPQTQINKLTIVAAFLMQKGEYPEASRILEAIAHSSRRGTELEVTQLGSFTGLMQNRPDVVRKQASMSCSQYDIINCWIQFQLSQWDTFPLTIRREDKLEEGKEWERLVESDIKQPLSETIFVNQIDIEEMDDKLIQLIPSP
jgi:tetratricopeptide (TPR) repeat protein